MVPKIVSQLKETKFAREGLALDRQVIAFVGINYVDRQDN